MTETIIRLALTFTNDDVIFIDKPESALISQAGIMRSTGWKRFRDHGAPDHLQHEFYQSGLPRLGWFNMDKVVSIHEVQGTWTPDADS